MRLVADQALFVSLYDRKPLIVRIHPRPQTLSCVEPHNSGGHGIGMKKLSVPRTDLCQGTPCESSAHDINRTIRHDSNM